MDTNTKNEINFLTKPILILVFVVIAIISTIVFGYRFIDQIRLRIATSESLENTLSKKVMVLETVERRLSGDVSFLDIVLPSKASVLYGLSQIKNQALNNNLTLSNLKTGNVIPESSGVMKASISFDVEGQELDIYGFLSSFSNVLPLMSIDKVSLNNSDGEVRATVTTNIYSADLPKTIPSLTGTVSELTEDDVELLTKLSGFTMPLFSEPVPSEQAGGKADPFN